jgi:predicted ribosome quality control (RQC) complex YloA/Tae2 family protein
VSNTIRYDSLLVRQLGRELHDTFAGERLDGVWFDRDRLRVTIRARGRRRSDAAPSLLWQLHPNSGHLTPAPDEPGGSRVQLPTPAVVAAVRTPPDERVIVFTLRDSDAPAGMTQRIVIELMTNQWNAVAVGSDGRITAVLRERTTRDRVLRAGEAWSLPRPSGRAGTRDGLSRDHWSEHLGLLPPSDRLAALTRFAAYASPQNAGWILGAAAVRDDDDALQRAFERYHALAAGRELKPILLRDESGWQPYALVPPLPAEAEGPLESLLVAFAIAAERAEAAPVGGVTMEEALDAVARRMDSVQKRVHRLRDEQAGAMEEAARLRSHGDILLSQLHAIRRGSEAAELFDFHGQPIRIPLDPAISAADNAAKLYDTARKRERAAARIPELLQKAEGELADLDSLAGRIREGTAAPGELERLKRTRAPQGRDPAPLLPYREYRTTRGLEVRVGRGARANDDLTFRHSSPNDVWLHARDVAGAHVILRWTKAEENPPAADIAEAAVLAALYSRARTSGTVPVDWTRRKHVRKPRKAGPGLVIPERVKTVFVEPDPGLEPKLRVD